MVLDHENQTEALRTRMDNDYDLWRLEGFGEEEGYEDFRTFTSNDPRTFATKVVSLLSAAEIMVKTLQDGSRPRS